MGQAHAVIIGHLYIDAVVSDRSKCQVLHTVIDQHLHNIIGQIPVLDDGQPLKASCVCSRLNIQRPRVLHKIMAVFPAEPVKKLVLVRTRRKRSDSHVTLTFLL